MTDWFEAIKIVDRPIVLYPTAIKAFGGHAEAAFVMQIRFWMGICKDQDGHWVFKTSDELEESLCLTRRQQEYVREKLTDSGVLETEYRRAEHLLYFRINREVFNTLLEAVPKKGNAPEHPQKREMASPKKGNGIPKKGKSINTETTQRLLQRLLQRLHSLPTSLQKTLKSKTPLLNTLSSLLGSYTVQEFLLEEKKAKSLDT